MRVDWKYGTLRWGSQSEENLTLGKSKAVGGILEAIKIDICVWEREQNVKF